MLNLQRDPERVKQPAGLYALFLIELWERYGYYTVSGLLILFMSHYLHLTDKNAYQLFAAVVALLYVAPTVGGYLADRFINYHQSLVIGALLLIVGYALLATPNLQCFYYGLSALVLGTGFFKFSPSTLLANLYKNNNANIDSGYTLFYMGINIGSFAAFAASGFIAKNLGWHVAFLGSAVGVSLALLIFMLCKNRFLANTNNIHAEPLTLINKLKLWLSIAAALVACEMIVRHVIVADSVVVVIIIAFLAYLAHQAKNLPRHEKGNLLLAVILSAIAIVFFILYCQQPMTVTLFTDRNVDHNLFGMHIPTASFEALGPFWIIALSPLLAKLYEKLSRHKKDLSIAKKYGIGIMIMGLGYFCLAIGAYFHNQAHQISALWLVGSYALQSIAELLVSALGLAMIARLAPKSLTGVMMGGWFIALAAGSLLAGYFSELADIPKNMHNAGQSLLIYQHCFYQYAIFSLGIGAMVFLLAKKLMRLASEQSRSAHQSIDCTRESA